MNNIVVVIPAFKVKKHILSVISEIDNTVNSIIVVDDKCPEKSGEYVKNKCKDPRVIVIFSDKNLGVGGAVKLGFQKALELDVDIAVKVDGDGQMPPKLISKLIKPIILKRADYVKGNRFRNVDTLLRMPNVRLVGNSFLSLINKFVNGYWSVMDPTNGFVAINSTALKLLPLNKIDNGYFFESDMLFRLSTIRAVVRELPMDSFYADEVSSLRINKILFSFTCKYINRFFKRIFYSYFLRDFNVASLEIITGLTLFVTGAILGCFFLYDSLYYNIQATSGQVMLATLPIILGFILLLMALHIDIANVPKEPLSELEIE